MFWFSISFWEAVLCELTGEANTKFIFNFTKLLTFLMHILKFFNSKTRYIFLQFNQYQVKYQASDN